MTMKYLKAVLILVLIASCLPSHAQTGGDTPELATLLASEADAELTADMTRLSELYASLMWAVYCRTEEYNIAKSKMLYDALIQEIEAFPTILENGILTTQDVSFIYTERASLRYPKLQDIKGGESDARTAIELNPENVRATWVLAQIITRRFIYFMERNRNTEAPMALKEEMFRTLQRVVELDPDHDRAYYYLGSIARDFGDTETALNAFKALTRIVPYEDEYHRELAELYLSQNRIEDALQSYERVVTIRPEQHATRNHLGQLYLQTGDYASAIETFRAILSELEGAQDTPAARAAANLRAQRDIAEVEIEAHHGISLAYQAQNDFQAAEFHIVRMIALLEEKVKRTRSSLRSRSRDRVELAKRLRDARYTLGHIYLKFNAPQNAIQTFAEALEVDEEYAPALSAIGMAYQMEGNVEEAETYLRRAIEISSEEELPEAYNALGYLYAEEGINLDEAATLVRRALKSSPQSGAYLDSLGLIYFKQGKLDAAIENLEKALRYLPDTPEILLHLADAYLEKGLKEKALQTLEQATLLEPNNVELQQRLEAVKSR